MVVHRRERFSLLLCASGLERLARLSWRGLLVFTYHRIGRPGEFDDPDLFSATVEDFDTHVRLLADRFCIVPAGAADLDLARPARRIAITLDDGYRDQVEAARVLRRHGVPGSFFICTGFVDAPRVAWWDEIAWLSRSLRRDLRASPWLPEGLHVVGRPADQVRRGINAGYKRAAGEQGEAFLDRLAEEAGQDRLTSEHARDQWMGWDDVRDLVAAGMEVGGHTVSHPVLATLPGQAQREEIAGSLRRLRDELHRPIDTFAYPVGGRWTFDDRTTALLAEVGVRRAFSFCGGVNPRRTSAPRDPYDVLRVGVFREDSSSVVRATAAMPHLLAAPGRRR